MGGFCLVCFLDEAFDSHFCFIIPIDLLLSLRELD